ncbi:MAG: hypothetical protein QN183_09225 [Armatimonadota bacterium]|nr:hypothetical protein [Armatimonadota bacterium]MDR7534002.1 hypothetical protein [Armatimonadota bacterium]MDR7536533.1 hypothetical protein [Armatimonadota bacterium]
MANLTWKMQMRRWVLASIVAILAVAVGGRGAVAASPDSALAGDYRRALEAQGFRVLALAITDRRATGGARRADIVYVTRAGGTAAALRPEVARVAAPGANPRLALDLITVRAVRPNGSIVLTVTMAVPHLDRWLHAQLSDAEFYRTWTIRTPPR